MTARVARSAAALLIGNELLTGKIREANLYELACTLRQIGVPLRRVNVVPDDVDTIASEVATLAASHDVVFTSGGVGPTHDDVTIEAVARAFGVAVITDPTMERLLRSAYGERCTVGHLRMALVPEGAELATTAEVAWPTVLMRNVWVLPGVPEIFKMKLAVVREHVTGERSFVTRAVYTKMDEGELKPLLDEVVAASREVEIGSYPKFFDPAYRTKITFDGTDPDAVEAAEVHFLRLLPETERATGD